VRAAGKRSTVQYCMIVGIGSFITDHPWSGELQLFCVCLFVLLCVCLFVRPKSCT